MSKYSPQQLQLIKKKINTLHSSNSTWKALGWRHKTKNGERTGDVAITLLTKEKLSLDQIDSNDLFPESITIPGISEPVKTDVQVADTDASVAHEGSHQSTSPHLHDIGTEGLRDIHPVSGSWHPWHDPSSWVMPVSGSRSPQRPLSGGISCSIFPIGGYDSYISTSDDDNVWTGAGKPGGNNYNFGNVGSGTFGGLCIDLDDNTVVGISNNHVLAHQARGDQFFWDDETIEYDAVSAYTNQYGVSYWSILSANESFLTSAQASSAIPPGGETRYPVYQSGAACIWSTSKAVLDTVKVGTVKRAYPLINQGQGLNKIDVAIFALDPTVSNLFSKTESWKQYGLERQDEDMAGTYQGISAMGWATTDEIDSLAAGEPNEGAPVFRSGRTDGPVGWPGTSLSGGEEQLHAVDVMGTAWVNYSWNQGYLDLAEVIYVSGGQVDAGSGGDSGTLVYALFNEGVPSLSAWKVIGLLFGANDHKQYIMCNRIDNVASMFNLSAYRGEDLDIGYKNVDIQVVESRQTAVTAMIGGKMYWQAGSTNSPPTRVFDT